MNNSGISTTNKEQKLFLASISKIGLFTIFLIFGICVSVSLIISLNAPKPWSSNEVSTWKCSGNDQQFNNNCAGVNLLDKSKKITLQLGAYNVFNQETGLEYYFMKKSNKRENSFNGNIKFKYTLYGTNVLNQPKQKIGKETLHLIEEKMIENKVICKAKEDICEVNHIVSEMYLDFPIYIIEISVVSENVKENVGDLIFKTTHVSSYYTSFELMWRLFFILFSGFIIMVYLFCNRKIPQDKWSHEQKWTVVLLTFLIWENNPLYPYEFLMDNAFYLFVNSVIDTVFICFLMFYVLIMFDALRKSIRQRTTVRFYLPRALLCGLLFTLILISFMYNKTRKIYSPTMTGSDDVVNILISIGIMALLIIYIFWLIFSIIRSFSEVKKLGTTGYRVQVYGLFTIFVILLYISLLLSAFFMGYRNNAAVSLTTIAYVNFYCMVLAILYLPANAVDIQPQRAQIVKLDEDDIFELKVDGSEEEENNDNDKNEVIIVEN